MPPRSTPRALALAAAIALATTGCKIDGLTLVAPTTDKPKAQGSAAPGVQAPAGQPAAPGGDGKLVFPANVKQPGATEPAGPGQQPGLTWPTQPGQPQPLHSHDPLAVGTAAPGMIAPAELPAPVIADDVPELYKRIYGVNAIKVEDGYVVITTSGLPDHGSPYYENSGWTDRAEAFNGDEQFAKSPGTIYQVGATYRIPLRPVADAAHAKTPMGPMGIALNGIPFYNQYQGEGNPLGGEYVSFDQYRGHPDPSGEYHYHIEPEYLTAKYGREALLGFLLDGFPVYGPVENGEELVNADLDAYHGHSHATADFPDGIYHYHFTKEAPYLNGDGFYGKAGTVVVDRTNAATPGGGSMGTMSPPPGGTAPQPGMSPPPGGMSPPPGGTQPMPGGSMPPPPSGCPTPPPPGQTPAPPPPGSTPPPAYCPKPPMPPM